MSKFPCKMVRCIWYKRVPDSVIPPTFSESNHTVVMVGILSRSAQGEITLDTQNPNDNGLSPSIVSYIENTLNQLMSEPVLSFYTLPVFMDKENFALGVEHSVHTWGVEEDFDVCEICGAAVSEWSVSKGCPLYAKVHG